MPSWRRRHVAEPARSSVSIGFSDGGSADYDLVIGADGIGSTMRALAIGATAPRYCGQAAWRALAPIRRKGADEIQFWLGEGSFFTTYPVSAERTYGCAYVAEATPSHRPVEGRLARFRDCLATFGDPVQTFLNSLERDDQIHCSAIEAVELPEVAQGPRAADRRRRPREFADDGPRRLYGGGGRGGLGRVARDFDDSRCRSRRFFAAASSPRRLGPGAKRRTRAQLVGPRRRMRDALSGSAARKRSAIATRRCFLRHSDSMTALCCDGQVRKCEGFRMPAAHGDATYTGGRRPKASKGGNRDRGRWGGAARALWRFERDCCRG